MAVKDTTNAPADTVATDGAKPKRIQIATQISPDQHDALQNIRWEKRHDRISDTLREAVREYVERHSPTA